MDEVGALVSPNEVGESESADEIGALVSPNEVGASGCRNETSAIGSLGAVRDGSATIGRDGARGSGAGRDERTGRGFVATGEPEASAVRAFCALRTRGNATIRGVKRAGTTAGRGGVLDGRGGVLDGRVATLGDRTALGRNGVLDGRVAALGDRTALGRNGVLD